MGMFVSNPNLDRRFADAGLPLRSHRHVVGVDTKRRRLLLEGPPNQQRKRSVGCLELVAFMLQRLDARQHGAELRGVLRDVEPELLRFHDDVAAPGELADQHLPAVAHERRIDVLIAAKQLLDGVHVRAALVRERGGPHPGQPRIRPDIGHFVDELRELLEERNRLGRHRALLQLDCKIRDQGRQIAVAGPLAESVDGPLHVGCPGVDGRQRIGHAEADIVVRVDPDPAREPRPGRSRDLGDLAGHRSAVRVAQDDDVGAAALGGLPGGERVSGIVLVAVEGVLGVVDDEAALLGQEPHRLLDHRQVLVRRRLEHFAHMQQPRLAENRHDGRFRVDQQPHLIIVFGADVFASRRPERRELRVGELPALGFIEELDVLRVRSRPAALDVVHAEAIQTLGDLELVGDGKRHALSLTAIAERGVVDFDVGSHPADDSSDEGAGRLGAAAAAWCGRQRRQESGARQLRSNPTLDGRHQVRRRRHHSFVHFSALVDDDEARDDWERDAVKPHGGCACTVGVDLVRAAPCTIEQHAADLAMRTVNMREVTPTVVGPKGGSDELFCVRQARGGDAGHEDTVVAAKSSVAAGSAAPVLIGGQSAGDGQR